MKINFSADLIDYKLPPNRHACNQFDKLTKENVFPFDKLNCDDTVVFTSNCVIIHCTIPTPVVQAVCLY